MEPAGFAIALSIGFFIGMVVCLELGFRLGLRDSMRNPERAHEGVGVIDAAVFALLGLLLGFSFAGGTSRLDARRELVVREANAIGTAYLRIDLLPSDAQPEMRHLFRKYLDARLRVYESLPDEKATEQALADVRKLQQEIWTRAISSSHGDSSQNIGRLLLPALNEMIDITTARTIAMRTHLPALIFVLLAAVALLSGVLAGFAMAKRQSRSWLHLVLYAGVVSVTIYAVLDLDYPRSGFIRLGAADSALIQLRDSIR